jgi:hypothetical protein
LHTKVKSLEQALTQLAEEKELIDRQLRQTQTERNELIEDADAIRRDG